MVAAKFTKVPLCVFVIDVMNSDSSILRAAAFYMQRLLSAIVLLAVSTTTG